MTLSALEQSFVFTHCPLGHALEFGFCPACQPAAHATSRALALEAERSTMRLVPESRTNSDLATLIEQRRDAHRFTGLVAALRAISATYAQQRLAARLTTPRAMKRAKEQRK
jgi:hypothetical protein